MKSKVSINTHLGYDMYKDELNQSHKEPRHTGYYNSNIILPDTMGNIIPLFDEQNFEILTS